MTISIDNRTEWLEADGLGGYASGTTGLAAHAARIMRCC